MPLSLLSAIVVVAINTTRATNSTNINMPISTMAPMLFHAERI